MIPHIERHVIQINSNLIGRRAELSESQIIADLADFADYRMAYPNRLFPRLQIYIYILFAILLDACKA